MTSRPVGQEGHCFLVVDLSLALHVDFGGIRSV